MGKPPKNHGAPAIDNNMPTNMFTDVFALEKEEQQSTTTGIIMIRVYEKRNFRNARQKLWNKCPSDKAIADTGVN